MRIRLRHLNQPSETGSGKLDVLRDKIIKLIQEEVKANVKFKNLTYEDLELILFSHPATVRLTYTGYLLLSKIMKCYTFEHTLPPTAKIYIGLSKIKYPFYLNAKTFVLFSEEDALLLSLHGGDLALFLSKMGETFED